MNNLGPKRDVDMKEFEFEFDDELFGESNYRERKVEEAYKPKQCDPEWFMQCSPNNDQSERQTIRKYQGDLLFHKQNYTEALTMYQESRQFLPSNNAVLDRELIESMAICLLKLGKYDDAVTLVKKAMGDNQQNDSSFWYLLSRIYRAMGNIQGEIDALQRCATLHSWNAHFWFSLAVAYEKASANCIQDQDGNFKDDYRSINFPMHSEMDCKVNSLNDECQSQKTASTIICCCASNDKAQGLTQTKPCDSDELEIKQSLVHLAVREQADLVHFKYHHFPSAIQSDESARIQDHSETICYSSKKSSESMMEDCHSCLFQSDRERVHEEYRCAKDKLKWRYHVLAFGSLVKTRFFLEKAIESSSSFAKDKSKTRLREVNDRIASHTDCGCAQLIDKAFEMLYSSVLAASEQAPSDQEQCDTKMKESKQQENSAPASAPNFEQKWFGDLLLYMDGN